MEITIDQIRELISESGIFDEQYYLQNYSEQIPAVGDLLMYWIESGSKLNHNPNALFNTEWYLKIHNSGQSISINPLVHYLTIGWRNLSDPGPHFSVEDYLSRNGDVAAAGIDPLTHYVKYGRRENRPVFRSKHEEFFFPILPHTSHGGEFISEPGIKPSAPKLRICNDIVERSDAIVRLLREKEAIQHNGQGQNSRIFALEFALLKLTLAAESGGVTLPSTEESEATSDYGLKAMLSLGIVASNEIDTENMVNYNVPILDRYTNKQLEISGRLRLDPKNYGIISGNIKISLIMPVYKSPVIFLERAILSVLLQSYSNWELILVNDFSRSKAIDTILNYYRSVDSRIKVVDLPKNGGISEATNAGLEVASGEYIGLIDHDDMVTFDALAEVVGVIEKDSSLDFVYSDEAKITEDDIVDEIYTKPDWSPILLLNLMYTGHFSVYRKDLIVQAGGFRSQYDFSQDYDLALRVSELTKNVAHIKKCLYGWRMIPGSAAVGDKPTARQSNLAALQSAADRRGYPAIAVGLPTGNRLIQVRNQERPLVSIIIPSDNFKNILSTVESGI